MDPSHLNRLLATAGVDLWSLIDAAIAAAAAIGGDELKSRRDAIVERIYAPPPADHCRNCRAATPPSPAASEDGDVCRSETDDGKIRLVEIKDLLEDNDQSDESIVSLLQNLLDMDITFQALTETDIGRQVNQLRKRPSGEVRQLAKLLIRKWKDIVDEWVKTNPASPAIITDGESPQEIPRKHNQNGQQINELGHSPNPQNGYFSNGVESVQSRAKTVPPPQRREAPVKSSNSASVPASTSAVKDRKDIMLDPVRMASARKRLQDNYQEVENAKKLRTIQVMDINDIPKPKNSFARKGGFHAKHL